MKLPLLYLHHFQLQINTLLDFEYMNNKQTTILKLGRKLGRDADNL